MHVTRSIRLPVPAACAAALLAAGLTLVHAPRPAYAADDPSPVNAGPPTVSYTHLTLPTILLV